VQIALRSTPADNDSKAATMNITNIYRYQLPIHLVWIENPLSDTLALAKRSEASFS
jgi:hypothetical protein